MFTIVWGEGGNEVRVMETDVAGIA